MSRTRWRYGAAFALMGVAAAVLPAGAEAHHVQSVTIAGDPVVGSTLTAIPVLNVPAVPVLEYRWQRCTTELQKDCARIMVAPNVPAPSQPTYTVAAADKGFRLAVRVLAAFETENDSKWSPLTAVVTDPVPVPTPTPTPSPSPSPTPTPTPTPDPEPDPEPATPSTVFSQVGASPAPVLRAPSPAAPATLRFLRPFPVVRVKGSLVPGGADITLLRVKAPSSATVAVRCKGPGCRLDARYFGTTRIGALERVLRAGARITIRVMRPPRVGKYVRLVVRDGSPPKRRDACLLPGSPRPEPCPAA